MTNSRRAILAAALFAVAASMLDAPVALAADSAHVSGPTKAVHGQERLPFTKSHLPSSHQAQPRQPVEDPLADLILG
jgi:hypothetical protein